MSSSTTTNNNNKRCRQDDPDESAPTSSSRRKLDHHPVVLVPKRGAMAELLVEQLSFSSPVETVQTALDTLAMLCGAHRDEDQPDDRPHRQKAVQMGAHTAVLQAMLRWKDHPTVQANGCRCLTVLTFDSTRTLEACLEMGVVPVVLNSMSHLENDERVQRYGCAALANLTSIEDNDHVDEHVQRYLEPMVQALVQAMQSFPDEVQVQKYGCIAICNLAEAAEDAMRQPSNAARIIPVAQTLQKNYPYDYDLQLDARDILHVMSEDHTTTNTNTNTKKNNGDRKPNAKSKAATKFDKVKSSGSS